MKYLSKPYFFFFFLLLVYLSLGFGVTISNDSVTNLDQITAMDIWSRSSHFSFHLFGVAFYTVFSLLLGFQATTSIEIMLSVFSVLGSISLYYVVEKNLQDRFICFATVLIYAFSTGVFRFSIQAEYLILIPSFALISLFLYQKKHTFFSGIVYALGLLTSPFTLLFAPAFFLYNQPNTIFTKKNYWFVGGFLLMYILVSYFTFSETVSGEWSYGVVWEAYKVRLLKINYLRVASIWIYGYLRSFIIVLPFVTLGLVISFKQHRKLFYIVLSVFLLHLPAAIPEARYGGYQLTFYPLVAILAAIGLKFVYNKSKIVALTVLILFLILNNYIVLTERNFNHDLKDTYVMLQESAKIPDKSLLIVYQAVKPIQTIYSPKLQVVGINTPYKEYLAKITLGVDKNPIENMIENNQNIYLLESGVSMPDDHVKLLFGKFVKNQGAKVKGFGKEKLLKYFNEEAFVKLEKFPIDVYAIKK